MLYVNEIFESIQGEGPFVGVPALFVRLQGCNLSELSCGPCKMCDTSYAISTKSSPLHLTEGDFLQYLKGVNPLLLVITGGEPLRQQEDLLKCLTEAPRELVPKINVETNGTISPSSAWAKLDTLFSVSPKPHSDAFLDLPSFKPFERILKVVYDETVGDFTFARQVFRYAAQLGITSTNDIYVMPESRSRETFIKRGLKCFEFCMQFGFRFGPREHLVLFDGVSGR